MFARMAVALFGTLAWGAEEAHTVPYVPSAAAEGHAGVVRIESRSGVSGEVSVVAVDDAGQRVEAGRLTLHARTAVEFEMAAMESGDASLGLAGTGRGEGDWRLELSTNLDIEARAYARSEGFATALHDATLLSGEVEFPLFHPGGDARRSVLRLANARGEPAAVSVRGVDDAGRAAGPVTVDLGAWEARGYAAEELESGSAAGLSGSLGDGAGNWRLFLEAERGSAYALNLLLDGSGTVSSVPGGMSRGSGVVHRVPLFPSAADGSGRRGVVRVVNRSAAAAEVSIEAFDATDRVYEELRLALEAESSAEFDSMDLEQGNAAKGLEGSTGSGEGDWWLELASESDIEVLSYVDGATGPLSAVRGTAGAETETGMRYEVVLLSGEASELRLLNAGGETVEVRVSGTDDAGSPGGEVELTLAPWTAGTLTTTALAEGSGVRGALGAGTGSWRLSLEADGEIDVLSLVRGAGGKLSDVSRRGRPAGAPPRTEVIDATALGADLWVAASASEAELSPGEAFDLRATVGNRGGDASATTLRYYRSADASITAGDAEAGTDAVAALAAGATSAESLTVNAPTAAGTYYYGACADAVAEETSTSNNCSAAVAVKVTEPPPRPDLVVTAASASEAELSPGEAFELTATVGNRGGDASATTLRYYRSADASITAGDAEVGTDAVAALAAGATSAESLTLNAPTAPGTYYYGACADAVAEETNTSNNCSAAVAVKVTEPRPDLVVTAASASEAELSPGEAFDLRATVGNRGGTGASATTLRYYRSADASITTSITTSDTQVGTDAVAALAAGATSAESLTLNAPTAPGAYYYGACADAVAEETNTSNNCSAAVAVKVTEPPPRPDLVVTAASASEAELSPGAAFELTATVGNRGGDASATTLRYHRSADAAITTSDTQVGTDAVAALAAGATSAESLTLNAPTAPGAYYYGACADAVAEETNTSNNCSAAVAVKVTEPPPRPDLVVTAASASEAELSPGEAFELTATVGNRGGDASATTLRYHRSADASITAGDAEAGTDAVAALAAGATSAESLTLNAPTAPGTHYYGACADAVAEETSTSNNCSAAVAVKVTEPPPRPDLVVTAASASEAELSPGEAFELTATVGNRGGDASATTLRYHRSADASITAGDAEAGTDAVAALAAGATSAESLTLNAPTAPGAYYYGACADAVAEETNTSNNCSAAVAVKVTEPPPRPDLVVTAASASEAELSPGAAFELTATVGNRGGDASATTLRYYRSADAAITTSDTQVGTDAVAALAAGATSAESLTLNAPTAPGTHYYGACADAVAEETNTSNNCSAAVAVKVTEPPPRPDLVVTAASASEAELSPGEAFELTATVGNRGGDASATTLRYHRSADASITAGDAEVGTDAVAALAAGATSAESLTVNAPTAPGTYYYGACADAVAEETNTSNNCSAAVAVTVREPPRRPDLVVTAMLSDAELDPGESFTLSATVGNRGGAQAQATTLRYYRSADASITAGDAEAGTDAVAALAAGTTSAESLTLNAPTAPGTHYYGACADAVAEETNTSNNCSAAVAVKVTEPPPRPDLVVTAASASEAELSPGEAFELTATVGNRGGDASATTLRYYRSTDATITTSDTEEGTDAVDELAASGSSAESIELTAPSTSGIYYYGACVDAVPDEYDTTNNCSSSVEIRITVPVTRPNLAVVSPSVSDARPDPGVTFTFSATVRNLGDSASASSTLRYYRSSDATVSGADTQVDSGAVTSLGPADSSDESATLMAPSSSGTYYYGACVDAVEGESDMSDNCSAAVEVTVLERSGRPDLEVAARELDGPLLPGEEIRLSVSVRNIGTADAVSSKLIFRVSDDDVISLEDERAGSPYFTPVMAPDYGLNYQMPQYVRAPLRAGTYYYGACVDAVPDESDTTNNCSGVTVTVRERSGQPDLTVTAWTDEYAVCMHALVRNIGTERSVQTVLTWHYGSDSTTPPSRVPSLSPGETFQRGAGNGTAPGNYFACVHAVEGETITNNNCSEEVTIR